MGTMEFTNWLKHEMEERGITQAELSRKSGLSPSQISKIYNGLSETSEDGYVAIARGLGIPAETILRAAKLLPPKPEKRAQVDELEHLANMLGNEDLQEVIEYAKMRLKRKEEKLYKQKSSRSKRPARSVLKDI